MTECESADGEWGGICPACGKQLPPPPKPLASWKSERAIEFKLQSETASKFAASTSFMNRTPRGRKVQ